MAKTAKKIQFTPLEDRVLVQPLEAETVTAGGIVLPDAAQEKPMRGVVKAAGPGRLGKEGQRLPMPVAPGDHVIYGKYAGNDVKFDGEEYKVLRAEEILAKLLK
ncbi:MAG: co-chaperone GroES [Planctomycetota bacterium]|nr:MAG: co-chaperone GroES [Planctomycetota bacterium]